MNESARGFGKKKRFNLPSGIIIPYSEKEIKEINKAND